MIDSSAFAVDHERCIEFWSYLWRVISTRQPICSRLREQHPTQLFVHSPRACALGHSRISSDKTTLAHLIARHTKAHFVSFSAVTSGIHELREVVRTAEHRLAANQQKTILFVDEIHRFNKAQQDAFLP